MYLPFPYVLRSGFCLFQNIAIREESPLVIGAVSRGSSPLVTVTEPAQQVPYCHAPHHSTIAIHQQLPNTVTLLSVMVARIGHCDSLVQCDVESPAQ